MHKNNFPIYLAIAVVFGILLGTFFNFRGNSRLTFSNDSSNEIKVKRLINYIQRDYVDNVNTDELLDGAITQMLDKLDPHSVYIPKENLQAVTENMQGNFVGIGVQFRVLDDSLTVSQPIKGGPSIKVGIKAGDKILMADKDTLYGKALSSATIMKSLKGKPNTKVNLQIYRKTKDSLFNVEVIRGKVTIKSVDIAYMLNDSVGYIKLNRFARNTYTQFKSSLDTLLANGMTDLVLDLRGNGGGFIDIANKIVDEFLEDDKLIVFTKNNKGKVHESFATEKGEFEKGGLYVLIDQNSASASEIVAGALQDNDKGIIIGRRSFGKGLVQEEMDLGDGSAVRLTTARYYTPTGRSIQKPYAKNNSFDVDTEKGNIPKTNINYRDDLENRFYNGELLHRDSIKIVDSLQYKTPKGKIVYGGGGIIPDVFVPIDTTAYIQDSYFIAINKFAINYVDNHRQNFNNLTITEFIKNFDGDNTIYNQFLSVIKKDKLPQKTKTQVKKRLKAFIASELYNDEGLFRVNQSEDKMIQKVFELESNN